ncbi:type I-E CRISPR-associated protein Cse1/CasA [Streptomyces sp. DH12]|uniref:type I-E CRISPR-associated protein Cse1/CasA n=1 Tax=Streptomyces sp. DH12 TaxID=2857010 RepID=UPI001E4E6885|nr:type I-E CRISPR-associated protein Cse1/CasA [Streptomyces sp. DH12]
MPDPSKSQHDEVLSYDLTERPWLPVQRCDGSEDCLSLSEVFRQAGTVRRLVGEVPTQEFALMRLLLAIAHDALDGPADIDEWAELWEEPDRLHEAVDPYLAAHRGRFDLLHPEVPFFQVAGLRTERDEVFSLNRIVADVPNGDPFFTARMPGADRLGFDEAARWVVHAHAYDTSGIKTGTVGDPRVTKGKVYPLGLGWAGNLGGVLVEGNSLLETLLLNLIATEDSPVHAGEGDAPAWRRDPCGPGPAPSEELATRPDGVRDLYTWQTRRLRLCFNAQGVSGVVLGYGDPLAPHNAHTREPMSGWRRSQAQEKKLRTSPVYLPREHRPARSAWRGIGSLIADQAPKEAGQGPAAGLRPGIVRWVARLSTEGVLPRRFLIRARVVGAVYGTQQSVIDEIVDDSVAMGVVLLHEQDPRYAMTAIDAVRDAEAAVRALGDLAMDLTRAGGGESEAGKSQALEAGYATLDDPYRQWLLQLASAKDPARRREEWQDLVHRHISRLGRQLVWAAGRRAWEGRIVTTAQGSRWLNASGCDLWFRSQLNKALPQRASHTSANDEPPPVPAQRAATDASDPCEVPA